MNNDTYRIAKRLIAFCIAGAFWAMSMFFSSSFLGVEFDSEIGYAIGLGIAFAVTGLQVIFNSESDKMNFTVKICAILAYAYGIGSNVIGIHDYMISNGIVSWIAAGLLGTMIEVVAEPLALWALTEKWDGGDLLTNLFSGGIPRPSISSAPPPPPAVVHAQNNGNNQGGGPSMKPSFQPPHPPNQPQKR